MSPFYHPVFTIGHSTHSVEAFLALLRLHRIDAVADVRSFPSSKYNPQFNREPLEKFFRANGVKYVFLGQELGARSSDRSCYVCGRVQYSRLAQTPLFQNGIDRVMFGSERLRIALMCAEKEPLECHRTILVAKVISERGREVMHIHGDGHLESHEAALERLLKITRVANSDLFRSKAELLDEALARQEQQIAYVDDRQSGSATK